MGYNTTVVVINDALDQIEKDPEFGRKLARAISEVGGYRKTIDVSAGNHANAATVVESHHADLTAVVTVGGNLGINHFTQRGWNHHTEEGQVELLKAWAKRLGYTLVQDPASR